MDTVKVMMTCFGPVMTLIYLLQMLFHVCLNIYATYNIKTGKLSLFDILIA